MIVVVVYITAIGLLHACHIDTMKVGWTISNGTTLDACKLPKAKTTAISSYIRGLQQLQLIRRHRFKLETLSKCFITLGLMFCCKRRAYNADKITTVVNTTNTRSQHRSHIFGVTKQNFLFLFSILQTAHIWANTGVVFRELSFSRLECGAHDRLHIYPLCGIF